MNAPLIGGLIALLCIGGFATPALADVPTTAPAKSEISMGPMRRMTIPAMKVVSVSGETTFDELVELIGDKVGPLIDAVTGGQSNTSVIFVYHDVDPINNKPFRIDFCIPVPDDAKAPEKYETHKLGEFDCATMLVTGSVNDLKGAYGSLIEQMMKAGLKPGTETREHYLYFESPESPNDVTMIQIAIDGRQ